MPDNPDRWSHRPVHLFVPEQTCMVTAATLHHERLFHDDRRLDLLHDSLHGILARHDWDLEAWVVFPNHYHFVGTPSAGGRPLGDVINELHAVTARELNRYDGSPGRKVWFQFWDTRLTYAASYYARLRYVMYNPVKHGVVTDETAYPWGCAAWFARNLEPARLRRLRSYRCDRLDVFEPL